jgi:hypothetical protein
VVRDPFGRRVLFVVALTCVSAAPAAAQRETGPFAGLFGGDRGAERSETLDLRGTVYGTYDKTESQGSNTASPFFQTIEQSGAGAGADVSLAYSRGKFSTGGGVAYRQYRDLPASWSPSLDGTTTFSANIGRKTTLNASGTLTYAPYYQFAPFLGAGVNTGLMNPGYGFAAFPQQSLGVNAAVGLTDQFSKRSSISVNANWSDWYYFDLSPGGVSRLGGSATFEHKLTKALALHLGYGREFNRYDTPGASSAVNETIDVGVSYGDALQFGRQTALSFSTSTSAFHYAGDTHYRLNGSVTLSRGFTRTWNASVGYIRSSAFQPGFVQPILDDSVMVGLHGLLAPKVQWSTAAGYSRGAVGFGGSAYTSYSAGSRLTFGMTRRLGLYGQYGYYRYDMPPGASVFPLQPMFSRHGINIGFTLWTPLIDQVRVSS